jgi:lipid-A-disaccharide synthase
MVVAGEASGDVLAAELILALRAEWPGGRVPAFFGAGGAKMAAAGAELLVDMTSHAVVGLVEALKNYRKFRRIFDLLLGVAVELQPQAVVFVDFSGFNRRLAAAIRHAARDLPDRPKLIYYVSPQVWASRPKRARTLERDLDLLLSIFPFEKAWYAERAPRLRVEFVGHPIISRHAEFAERIAARRAAANPPSILLLPGSRLGEIKRHLPVLLEAARLIEGKRPARWNLVVPDERIFALAKSLTEQSGLQIRLQTGGLAEALLEADLAMASTGTVTMECAYFRVPAVALYKTSWSTYEIGKRIIQVRFLAMPNLLANEVIFPEFVQNDATGPKLAGAALDLLNDPARLGVIREKLDRLIATLGPPGASARAASLIMDVAQTSYGPPKGANPA